MTTKLLVHVYQGRKKYGYKLPVMYASVDIHVQDVRVVGHEIPVGPPFF